jgi:hypothetical protein
MGRHDGKGRPDGAGRPFAAGLANHTNSNADIIAATHHPASTEISHPGNVLDWLALGRRLVPEHTTAGVRWAIVPGNIPVAGRIARRAIRFANVVPHDLGLFAGELAQSYKLI